MTSRRILVVDDDRDVVHFLTGLLRKAGYTTLSAMDAMQALMQAQREMPDLILTDMLMPAGGGLTFLDRLMRSGKTNQIPVLVLTGSDEPDLEARALAGGAIRVLRKPCDNAVLLAAIREALGEGA
jgi:CheY-like chemotaxis protein